MHSKSLNNSQDSPTLCIRSARSCTFGVFPLQCPCNDSTSSVITHVEASVTTLPLAMNTFDFKNAQYVFARSADARRLPLHDQGGRCGGAAGYIGQIVVAGCWGDVQHPQSNLKLVYIGPTVYTTSWMLGWYLNIYDVKVHEKHLNCAPVKERVGLHDHRNWCVVSLIRGASPLTLHRGAPKDHYCLKDESLVFQSSIELYALEMFNTNKINHHFCY